MATWDFTAFYRFNPDTAGTDDSGRHSPLDDGQEDSVFTPSDTIASSYGEDGNGGYVYSGTYVGTIELSAFPGVTWVVLDQGYTTAAYGTVPAGTAASDVNDAFHSELGSLYTLDDIQPFLQNTDSLTTCFAAGTQIATPEGETSVEALKIGDLVATADGRAAPVKWIGRQTRHKLFTPAERFAPVRVTAGALGNGLPHSDLVLTADHALIVDGLAINAGALVNGTTICFDRIESLPERITYYHVETADHDVILANGAAAETYVDYLSRRTFDNHAEYAALYGEERIIPEMDMPRVSSARLVPPAIRARRAGAKAA